MSNHGGAAQLAIASRPLRWLRDLRTDVHHTARQLRRAPGPAAFIIATLALGIGANVTMAGVIDRLLLRAPAAVPERVRRLLFDVPGAPVGTVTSYPKLLDFKHDVGAFEAVGASTIRRMSLGGAGDSRELSAALVSPDFFRVFDIHAAFGRLFSVSDGFPEGAASGGPAVAVLGYEFWQREFGGDSSILGRPLRIGSVTYAVVGVSPPRFGGVDAKVPDAWLPLTVAADGAMRPQILEDRESSWLSVAVRLKAGQTDAAAAAQATRVARRDTPPVPPYDQLRVITASAIRGRGPDAPRDVRVALWLGGIAAMVLALACANVANLLLARAFTRRREIGVRVALGARRGRLVRQMLTESLVLALLSGGAALLLASTSSGLLRRFFLVIGDLEGGLVDTRLLLFVLFVALGTGVLVGLVPIAHSLTPDLTRALNVGMNVGGGRSARVRALLLAGQAALCTLLLVVAGVFSQSLRRVNALEIGLNPDHVLMADFDLNDAVMDGQQRGETYAELLDRVRAIPGVERAVLARSNLRAVNVHTATRSSSEHTHRTNGVPYESIVDSGYFRALGTPMRGRDFASADVQGAPPVAIINEPLANVLFPGEEALGQCVFLPLRADEPDSTCWTVVGVLRGYWYGRSILDRDGLLVYVPLAQRRVGLGRPNRMVITLNESTSATAAAVRNVMQQVRPDRARLRVEWMRDTLEPQLRPWRLSSTMFSLFGLLALVIAAVGLYAVVAFIAVQRAPEVAVRLALGARAHHVLVVVAGEGLSAVAAGVALGATASLGLRRWIGPLLFRTSTTDPSVLAGVALLLLVVAAVAILLPVRRALSTNPAATLRAD